VHTLRCWLSADMVCTRETLNKFKKKQDWSLLGSDTVLLGKWFWRSEGS